jgi:hypothetical protein
MKHTFCLLSPIQTVKRTMLQSTNIPNNGPHNASRPLLAVLLASTFASLTVMHVAPVLAQTDPYNPLPRDPNAPGLTRGNSNLSTPGRTDSLLSFGAAAQVRRVEMKTEKLDIPADSLSLVRITVKLLDADDKPVTGDVPVLLEATRGRIVSPGTANTGLEAAVDRDKTAPGTQATVKNGELSFDLVAPGEAGEGIVRVSAGQRKNALTLNFVPHVRDMIAVGLVEGIIVLRDQKGGLQPVRPGDGFEQDIRRWQRSFSGDDGAVGVRTAFFLKGKIKGETLLTAAYDSDKDVRGRLFRDIQPEEYYPVYGDASIKGYDAQTSGRFFVRADNGKNYVLYGDFNTVDTQYEAFQLSRYNRSLTGAKGHWGNGRASLTAFASKDNLRQVVDEVPGKGISGPYNLRFGNGVQNTEKVELLVRDRNAPAVVLRVTPQVRFVDYDFEPFSGRLLFKSPVPSLDENLNPVSIRVAYEVEEGGPKYWVGGVEGNFKASDLFTLGASYAKDENPLAKFSLAGVNAMFKMGDQTRLMAEFARSDRGDITAFGSASLVDRNAAIGDANTQTGAAKGDAWRIELRHQTERLEARAYVQRLDEGFTSTAASTASGRTEAGAKATYALTPTVRVLGEGTYSQDLVTDGKRNGASAGVAWDFMQNASVEIGVRHAEQTGAGATLGATAFPGTGQDPVTGGLTLVPNANLSSTLNDPYKTTSVRAKATVRPSAATSAFVEVEQDVENSDARAWAVGGDYRFSEVGRVYGRSEWASGLAGSYGLAGEGRQAATVLGVDAQYMKDGQVFSEYRLRDALAGREATAAVGLRNYWPIREGLRLSTNIERVKLVGGQAVGSPLTGITSSPEAIAAGLGVDYTASALWKGSARLEWRDDELSKSWLNTAALARKLSEDWTLLARNYWYRQNYSDGGKNHQHRFQIGAAWRQTHTNLWNALGKYEYRNESTRLSPNLTLGLEDLDAKVHIVSVDAEYHPRRPVWFAGKLAGKWRKDLLAGESSTFDAQLLQGRILWDITNRWDVGLIGSVLGEDGFRNRRLGVGAELGRVLTDNLWLSVGYNWRDLTDKDLLTDYSTQGPFIRLRFKFDENLLKRNDAAFDKTAVPTGAAALKQ